MVYQDSPTEYEFITNTKGLQSSPSMFHKATDKNQNRDQVTDSTSRLVSEIVNVGTTKKFKFNVRAYAHRIFTYTCTHDFWW